MHRILLVGALLALPAQEAAAPFAPGRVSRGRETMIALTPDGRTAYTTRVHFSDAQPPVVTNEIVRSDLVNGVWSDPRPSGIGKGPRVVDPVLSPDGNRMFFQQARMLEDGSVAPSPGGSDFDLWYVDRQGDGWGTPVRFDAFNTRNAEFFMSSTRDGTLYWSHLTPTYTNPVIVRARRRANGSYAPVETLSVVNAPGASAGNAFIAPDESFLVFADGQRKGAGGSDIWIAWRRGDSWTEPVNLGDAVNTATDETAPTLSTDGRTLFFTRFTRQPNALPTFEIMTIPLDPLIGKLRRS